MCRTYHGSGGIPSDELIRNAIKEAERGHFFVNLKPDDYCGHFEPPTTRSPGQRLGYFTIAYNGLEGIVSIVAGLIAGSVSLVGFGLDSLIEVASAMALLWATRLRFEAIPTNRTVLVTFTTGSSARANLFLKWRPKHSPEIPVDWNR